jgi:hypothetical protein
MAKEISRDIFSFDNIKKLSDDELIDRMDAVDSQATLIKWRLLWELRSRYPAHIQFGRFVKRLMDVGAISSSSRQVINRECRAGKWCVANNITDLNKLGIKKSVIYMLSSAQNKDVANKVFIKTKNQWHSIEKVKLMFEQERAITIEKEPDLQITYEPEPDYQPSKSPYMLRVVDNSVEIPHMPMPDMDLPEVDVSKFIRTRLEDAIDDLGEAIETSIENNHAFVPEFVEQRENNERRLENRSDLIWRLSQIPAYNLPEEQMVDEILVMCEAYGLSPIKLIPVLQACIRACSNSTYRKAI